MEFFREAAKSWERIRAKLQAENTGLQAENAGLRRQVKSLQATNQGSEVEMQSLASCNECLRADNHDLYTKLDSLQIEIKDLAKDNERLANDNERMQAESIEHKATITALELLVSKQQTKIKKLQCNYDVAVASRWDVIPSQQLIENLAVVNKLLDEIDHLKALCNKK